MISDCNLCIASLQNVYGNSSYSTKVAYSSARDKSDRVLSRVICLDWNDQLSSVTSLS